jgi:hypothetical protein
MAAESDAGFAPLAARRAILSAARGGAGSNRQLADLDRLHALATSAGIVTQYSSLLVLVNDAQRQSLEEAAGDSDRFQREYEAVGETTPPSPMDVTGVPEPEEWILIGLAALLLWRGAVTRRRSARLAIYQQSGP